MGEGDMPEQAAATPDARGPAFGPLGRGWKMVILASLAANLVVAGLVAGAMISGPQHSGGARNLAFGAYTFALMPQDRKILMDRLRERRHDLPGPREMQRADREDLARLLRREPFDRAEVARLFDAQRGRADARFRLGQDLLLDRLATLTPAERQAMADRLERGPSPD